MCFYEFLALNKHPTGAAARIEDPALVGFQHLNKESNDAPRGVELPSLLAFRRRKLSQEIFIDPSKNILASAFLVTQTDSPDNIDQFSESLLIQSGPSIILDQDSFEGTVVSFDRVHGIVDYLSDLRLLGVLREVIPSCFLRNSEDSF